MAFCDALGIVKPVVYGASFGGMVAMTSATRQPEHSRKFALVTDFGSPGAAKIHHDAGHKTADFTNQLSR